MKFKILISILAVVLVAGCTIPGIPELTTGTIGFGGKGLEITSFTAEPGTVYSNSKVRVNMEVENQGGTTVPLNDAIAYLTGSNVDLDVTGTDEEKYWRGEPNTSSTSETKAFTKNMTTADVVKGTPAGTARFSWTLTSPSIAAGQTRTDTFYGRVYCDYQTSVNGNIWVYTEGEMDAARASNRAINKASFTSTTGPVGLEVKVSPDPVVWYSANEVFSLYITISNMASGTIYVRGKDYSNNIPTIDADEYNIVYVSVDRPSDITQTTSECSGSDQELPAGKSTTLVCEYTMPSSPGTFKSYPFTITAQYGYYTERSATVTVQGR